MRIDNLHEGMKLFHYYLKTENYSDEYPAFDDDWEIELTTFEVLSFELYNAGDIKSLIIKNLKTGKERDAMKAVLGMTLYTCEKSMREQIEKKFNDVKNYDIETIKNRQLKGL